MTFDHAPVFAWLFSMLRQFARPLRVWLALGLAVSLAACGGGGGGGGDGGTQPPSSAPSIIGQPASVSVTAGQAASFSVNVTGTAPITFAWSRNGAVIPGANAATYTLASTTVGDTGAQFSVVVSNAQGSVTSTPATLTVSAAVVAPSVTSQPVDASATAGQTATFSVTATGSGTLAYQWRREGVNVAGANAATYTTPTLALSDNGVRYDVVVSNEGGSVTSATARLTVTAAPAAPAIVNGPAAQTVIVGQLATFSVEASGSGPLSYQWRRNGSPIGGATSLAYTTPVTTLGDNGASFDVVVSNNVGSATSSAVVLTVQAPVAANYWLRGEAGVSQDGTIAFANGPRAATPHNLILVNPDQVPATVLAEARGAWLLQASVTEPRFNPQNAGDDSERFVVYARGTRLWRLDLLASNGTPAPAQVSNASLTDFCAPGSTGVLATTLFQDTADAGRAVLQYQTPGADAACGTADDRFVALRVNAASTDAPVAVPRLLTAIANSAGAITGFLARDGNSILRLDANFANPTAVFTVGAGELELLRTPVGPGVIVLKDGTALRAYDPTSGAAPVNFATAAADFAELGEVGSPVPTAYYRNGGRIVSYRLDGGSTVNAVRDLAAGQTVRRAGGSGQQLLLALSNGTGSTLLAIDAAGGLRTITEEAGTIDTGSAGVTPTRVLYTIDNGRTLRSVLRTGGTAVTLASSPQLRVFNSGSWGYETVWYDQLGAGNALFGSEVRVLDSDGSNPMAMANAVTIGGASFNGFTDTSIGRIVAQPVSSNAATPYAGVALLSLDPVTRATRVNYGTLANAPYNFVNVARLGPDRPGLVSAIAVQGFGSSTIDLYYVRVGSPGLVRLTNFAN